MTKSHDPERVQALRGYFFGYQGTAYRQPLGGIYPAISLPIFDLPIPFFTLFGVPLTFAPVCTIRAELDYRAASLAELVTGHFGSL